MEPEETKLTIDDVKAIVKEILGATKSDEYEAERRKALEAQGNRGAPTPPQHTQQDDEDRKQFKKENRLGRLAQYMARTRMPDAAFELAKSYGDLDVAAMFGGSGHSRDLRDANAGNFSKVMGSDLVSTGGALIAPNFAEEVIPILEDESVCLNGVTQVPMPNGTYSQSYGDTGPTVSFGGESVNVNDTTITTGKINMTAKEMLCIVAVPNQLLNDSSGRGATLVQQEINKAMGAALDLNILSGDGTQNKPLGLRYLYTGASQNQTTTSPASLATAMADLMAAIGFSEDDKVPESNPTWFMAPRTRRYLGRLITSNGMSVFPQVMDANPTLWGAPLYKTNQITITGGGGSDSEIYYSNQGHVLYGNTQELEMHVIPFGAYYNSASAAVVSGISRRETVFMMVMRWDVACKYRGLSGSYTSGVSWT